MVRQEIAAQRSRLLAAAVCGAVVSAAAIALLGLSGWFITGAALAGLAGGATVQAFNYLLPGALIRLLAILRTGARYGERVAGHEAALQGLARLRPQLFVAFARSGPGPALALPAGEASGRLVQDVDAIQTLFVRLSSPWALAAGAVTAVAMAALARPLAGVVVLTGMALAAAGGVLLGRRLADPAGRERQRTTGAFKARLATLEAATPELRAYGLSDWAVGEAAAEAAPMDRAAVDGAGAGGWIAAWQAAATGLTVTGAVLASVEASLPLIALAALAAVTGVEAGAGLVAALRQRGGADEALRRLDVLAPAVPGGETATADATLALLGEALRPGARIAIMGRSGAGKTTLIERLVGLRTPLAGAWTIGDRDLADWPVGAARPLVACATQDIRLIDGSVRQNLGLAAPRVDDAAMWAALEDVGLADRIRGAPGGLDAPVGPNGAFLSGGERRRLTLARAYLRDAPWLVLDEPTEGLDAVTEARVLERLEARLKATGQGLIVVCHALAPARLCETVLRVEGIAADGRVTTGAGRAALAA